MFSLCWEVGEHQQLHNYRLNCRPDLRKQFTLTHCLITLIVILHINNLAPKISKYMLVYINEAISQ